MKMLACTCMMSMHVHVMCAIRRKKRVRGGGQCQVRLKRGEKHEDNLGVLPSCHHFQTSTSRPHWQRLADSCHLLWPLYPPRAYDCQWIENQKKLLPENIKRRTLSPDAKLKANDSTPCMYVTKRKLPCHLWWTKLQGFCRCPVWSCVEPAPACPRRSRNVGKKWERWRHLTKVQLHIWLNFYRRKLLGTASTSTGYHYGMTPYDFSTYLDTRIALH